MSRSPAAAESQPPPPGGPAPPGAPAEAEAGVSWWVPAPRQPAPGRLLWLVPRRGRRAAEGRVVLSLTGPGQDQRAWLSDVADSVHQGLVSFSLHPAGFVRGRSAGVWLYDYDRGEVLPLVDEAKLWQKLPPSVVPRTPRKRTRALRRLGHAASAPKAAPALARALAAWPGWWALRFLLEDGRWAPLLFLFGPRAERLWHSRRRARRRWLAALLDWPPGGTDPRYFFDGDLLLPGALDCPALTPAHFQRLDRLLRARLAAGLGPAGRRLVLVHYWLRLTLAVRKSSCFQLTACPPSAQALVGELLPNLDRRSEHGRHLFPGFSDLLRQLLLQDGSLWCEDWCEPAGEHAYALKPHVTPAVLEPVLSDLWGLGAGGSGGGCARCACAEPPPPKRRRRAGGSAPTEPAWLHPHPGLWVPQDLWRQEQALAGRLRDLATSGCGHLLARLRARGPGADAFVPSEEQRRAAEVCLRSRLGVLVGAAGTGKTSLAGWLRCLGVPLLFVAVTCQAVAAARRAWAGAPGRPPVGDPAEPGPAGEPACRQCRGPPPPAEGWGSYVTAGFYTSALLEAYAALPPRPAWPTPALVVVDELSLFSPAALLRLLDVLAGLAPSVAGLLLLGDSAQLPSMGQGCVLALAKRLFPACCACLDTVRRGEAGAGGLTQVQRLARTLRPGADPRSVAEVRAWPDAVLARYFRLHVGPDELRELALGWFRQYEPPGGVTRGAVRGGLRCPSYQLATVRAQERQLLNEWLAGAAGAVRAADGVQALRPGLKVRLKAPRGCPARRALAQAARIFVEPGDLWAENAPPAAAPARLVRVPPDQGPWARLEEVRAVGYLLDISDVWLQCSRDAKNVAVRCFPGGSALPDTLGLPALPRLDGRALELGYALTDVCVQGGELRHLHLVLSPHASPRHYFLRQIAYTALTRATRTASIVLPLAGGRGRLTPREYWEKVRRADVRVLTATVEGALPAAAAEREAAAPPPAEPPTGPGPEDAAPRPGAPKPTTLQIANSKENGLGETAQKLAEGRGPRRRTCRQKPHLVERLKPSPPPREITDALRRIQDLQQQSERCLTVAERGAVWERVLDVPASGG
eukprot:g17590.t1